MELKSMGFMAACKHYFGLKPGQGLSDFMKEVKELTPKDREDLKALFPSVGYSIND